MDVLIAQLYSPSLDVIMLIIAVVVDLFLAFVVYVTNPHSATNRIFSLLTLSMMFWLVFTYLPRLPDLLAYTLTLHRVGIFFAAGMSSLFYLFAHTMPAERILMKRSSFIILIAVTSGMMILNLSPYAFVSNTIAEGISKPQPGIGFIPFALLSTVFSVLTVYLILRKYRRSADGAKRQFGLVLAGIVIMLVLVISTILIPIIVFNSLQFLSFAPLYTLAFLGMTAYAITKYQLFNIKVLLTQVLTLGLCLVLFAKLFGEETQNAQIIDGVVLTIVAILGFFLVRSVKREVEQREEIQELAKKLEESNWELARTNEQLRIIDQRKSEFVSIVSHQLRTPITAMKGYASLLLEGAYDKLTDAQSVTINKIFLSSQRLAQMVADFLDVSKIEQGTMTYTFTSVDLRAMLRDLTEDFDPIAKKKGLEMTFTSVDAEQFVVTADEGKIRQIISNIIDNAIKYTPQGSVNISLENDNAHGTVICHIKDSGIGLSQDDVHHLFGKFTRGSGGQKQNTEGSGLGLYVAMKMLEAQHGKIWVDSAGVGKGSTFAIELLAEEQM